MAVHEIGMFMSSMFNDPYDNYLLVLMVHSFVRENRLQVCQKWAETLVTVIVKRPVFLEVRIM